MTALGTSLRVAGYDAEQATGRLGEMARSYYFRKMRWPESFAELAKWSKGNQNDELGSIGNEFEIITWESIGPGLAICVRKKQKAGDKSEQREVRLIIDPPTRDR